MKAGCDILVLDLDGSYRVTDECGPIVGFCSLNGCGDCDGAGSWL